MEIFTKLGLKEVASIIGTMGKNTDKDVISENDIFVDGKKYSYYKMGNELIICDDEGIKNKIKINYSKTQGKDYRNNDITYLNHEVSIDYILENGDFINIYNNIGLDEGYETFENVNRHDLINGVRTKYCDSKGKELASFTLELGKICLKDNNKVYEFTDTGILSGNRVISLDGERLISISGFDAPTKEEAESFNINKEKEIIRDFLKTNPNIHSFTKEILEDSIGKLDRKERYAKDIINYYNDDLKEIKKAINIREKLINYFENDNDFSKVLDTIDKDFKQKTKNKLKVKALIH